MNRDESFERELRGTLDELAADPAPEELLHRVAAIPRRERATKAGLPRLAASFGAGFVAIAGAAAVLVVAAIVLLPKQSSPGPIAGVSPTPTATISPSSSTPQSPTPLVTPSVAASPVPSSFPALSVTFVSPDHGFLLGSVMCNGPACAAVAQTTDAGRTWTLLSRIGATALPSGANLGSEGVTTLRFATATDGWAFGPQQLFTTHDGGATWSLTSLPGFGPDSSIEALETAAGLVHAVVLECSPSVACQFTIKTSDIAQDTWRDSGLRLPVGAGPVPSAQLVLNGNAGWLVQNDRVVTNGARLENGTWSTWQPPCATLQGPVVLAASSPTDLVGACDVGLWANHEGERLFVSHDGGTTFTKLSTPIPVSTIGAVAAADASTAVVAGYDPGSGGASSAGEGALATTNDGGRTWRTAPLGAAYQLAVDLGFTTAQQGVVIVGGRLEMTRDGGQSWSEVNLAP